MITDGIFVLLIIYFLWCGIRQGLIKSLLGPAAFIIATTLAFIYYNITHNIPISLGIGLLGPLLLTWIFSTFFYLINKSSGGGTAPNLLSSLCGGIITIIWGLAMTIPIVYILGFMPPVFPAIAPVLTDIRSSQTFSTGEILAKNLNIAPSTPSKQNKNKTGNALEEVRQDARMQALLNDPKIQKAVEEKNYAAMLSNPQVMQMAQDPEFVKKLLAALQESQKTKPPTQE